MANEITLISIDKLIAHPDNPNRQSSLMFSKLVHNIEKTGKYEPILTRPHPEKQSYFQIINGHHRCMALAKLGYKEVDVIVWDVDDEQVDILLSTLNRLSGSDIVGKKLKLLRRLNKQFPLKELSKLLPDSAGRLDKLINFKKPVMPADIKNENFALPMIFFTDAAQKKIVENALLKAEQKNEKKNKAQKRTQALVAISKQFVDNFKK